jgi:hypothetical protein
MRKFFNISITLVLLSVSWLLFKALNKPIDNIASIIQIHGLKLIEKSEIMNIIESSDLPEAASLLTLNLQKISRILSAHPLIKSSKIKRSLWPSESVEIFITEESPWAVYDDKLIDQKGKIIWDKGPDDLEMQSVSDLYKSSSTVIKIQSYRLLQDKDIKILIKICALLEHNLASFCPETGTVIKISVDAEDNLMFFTRNYQFKLGPLNENALDKVRRMNLALDKIKELENQLGDKLLYFDLSLTTPELILGKKPL